MSPSSLLLSTSSTLHPLSSKNFFLSSSHFDPPFPSMLLFLISFQHNLVTSLPFPPSSLFSNPQAIFPTLSLSFPLFISSLTIYPGVLLSNTKVHLKYLSSNLSIPSLFPFPYLYPVTHHRPHQSIEQP